MFKKIEKKVCEIIDNHKAEKNWNEYFNYTIQGVELELFLEVIFEDKYDVSLCVYKSEKEYSGIDHYTNWNELNSQVIADIFLQHIYIEVLEQKRPLGTESPWIIKQIEEQQEELKLSHNRQVDRNFEDNKRLWKTGYYRENNGQLYIGSGAGVDRMPSDGLINSAYCLGEIFTYKY